MNKKLIIVAKKFITRLTIIIHHARIKQFPKYTNFNSSNLKFAIQFHIFFIDLLDEVYNNLKNISLKYDLYISTDTEEKAQEITKYFKHNLLLYANNINVEVVENLGRDIYPFFKQMTPIYKNYDLIGHFHTKKSTTSPIGNRWRDYLYNTLLNKNYINDLLIYMHDNKKIGIIAPAPYYEIIINYYENLKNKYNKQNVSNLLNQLNVPAEQLTINTKYPAGNMFFIRSAAVKQLFERAFSADDFPKEEGQVENTTQHTIELIWKFIIENNKYLYKELI